MVDVLPIGEKCVAVRQKYRYRGRGTGNVVTVRIRSIVGERAMLREGVYMKKTFSSDCKSNQYIYNNGRFLKNFF